jgi:hypothetical protein
VPEVTPVLGATQGPNCSESVIVVGWGVLVNGGLYLATWLLGGVQDKRVTSACARDGTSTVTGTARARAVRRRVNRGIQLSSNVQVNVIDVGRVDRFDMTADNSLSLEISLIARLSQIDRLCYAMASLSSKIFSAHLSQRVQRSTPKGLLDKVSCESANRPGPHQDLFSIVSQLLHVNVDLPSLHKDDTATPGGTVYQH